MGERVNLRNRIVGTGTLRLEEALFNPSQWRIHPQAQQDALASVLDEVGWVQQVIVNQQTGHLIDGHCRVTLADRREEESVPCVYVDLSPAEERLVIAALDATSHMASPDPELLRDLLEAIAAEEPHLGELVAAIGREYELTAEPEPAPHDPKTVTCPACGHEFEL
jgi:ParB-like chromosome segregation protein Spo0J